MPNLTINKTVKMLTTYIIIGGKSSRMGMDKAGLVLGADTFLNRIIKAVTPLQSPVKLVSSLLQHQNMGYPIIPDLKKEKGPVAAISSALSETDTPLNLILSCDVPLLQYNTLEWLLKQHNSNYEATIICSNGKKMPLVGIYNKSCFAVFNDHLIKNQLKLMRVLEDLNVNYIEIPEMWKHQILNINTPEQLKAIQS